MSDDERMKAGCLQGAAFLGMLLLGLMLCALLSSCTTTKVVEVERVRTDTTYITKQQRDSIYVRDSIYITEKQQGDTATVTIDRWHTEWRDRWRTDTIYRSRVDSVPVPVPVPEYVERELAWWQRAFMWTGGLVFVVAVIFIAWELRRWVIP